MTRTLYILLIWVTISISGFAQYKAKPMVYSGHIIGTEGEAVAYATVVLLQEERQKAGTVTDSLGYFAVETHTGSYTLIAQCIGYEPTQKNVILPTTRPDTLVLKASAFSLKEEASPFSGHLLGFANVNASFQLPANYTFEIQYSGTSRLYSGNSEVDPRHTVNLFARKNFADNRLLLTAAVNNIFGRQNSYVNRIEAYTAQSQYASGISGRIFKVSLTWNFNSGKQIKKNKIERSSDAERNRLMEK